MKKYIHIGFPKNFSTSLQRDYFSKHPDIFHLGIGVDNNLGYRDSIVEKTLEVYLKTCKYYRYKEVEKTIIEHFQSLFKKHERDAKIIGVSGEHLGFAFSYDGLSGKEKAERLSQIFGSDTKIVMIIRNQFSLLKSLYREYVRVGFASNFSDFIKLLYKYQDRNFVYDFRYDYVVETYIQLFGKDNVRVFFFEDYRNEKNELILQDGRIKLFSDLNRFLGVSETKMDFGHYNEAIPSNKIMTKAALNAKYPHDLGNHLLESAEKHRIKKYLEEDLSFFEDEKETFSDVIIKRELIEKAVFSDKTNKLVYDTKPKWISFFKELYEEGNHKVAALLDQKLPKEYFNLNF